MIGHEAIAQHRHGHFDASVSHGFQEGLVVDAFQEHGAVVVAAVENMAAFAIEGGSRDSGRSRRLKNGLGRVNDKHA